MSHSLRFVRHEGRLATISRTRLTRLSPSMASVESDFYPPAAELVVIMTYQCKSRGGGGGGVRARGGDLMPETIPRVGLLIVRSDPRVGTFDFDR